MTNRILDLSESPAYLRCKLDQLVIERSGADPVTAPMADIAAVVLAHPQLTATIGALAALLQKGAAVVVCNRDSSPVGLLLPTDTHGTQTRNFAAQASTPAPLKKRLWQRIVQAKIRAQAGLLKDLHGDDHGLTALAGTVRSGDVRNVEAQASRRYWPALFADPDFRRRFDAPDANRLLNYGYAVLRALVARACCAAGLHPSLGLHHHNQYNANCLADDLMEPFRPLVDRTVVEAVGAFGADTPLDRRVKAALLEGILARYTADGEVRTLFDVAARTAVSLADAYLERSAARLYLPKELDRAQDATGAVGLSPDVALHPLRPAGGDQAAEA